MNLSRTLSTSVIALALSVPLVLMARSGDGLPATSRVDQATTSTLVYGLLSDRRYAYRPRPLDGTLSADFSVRYLLSHHEIGKPSCRARVCTSVYNKVVAV